MVARRRGLEAANRKRRSKAEEALVEALKRLQARGEAITAKKTALRGPIRRGGEGGSLLPPPLPGPSRPLRGGCGGFCGRESDPGWGPGLTPPFF